MLDLAIFIDTDAKNTPIVETNNGVEMKAPDWPQDCDFQLIAFDPSRRSCEVVSAEGLAEDIGEALAEIDKHLPARGQEPEWYRRLKLYARQEVSSK